MRICKLDTTSQIWGSGVTDMQGNLNSAPTPSTPANSQPTFSISPSTPNSTTSTGAPAAPAGPSVASCPPGMTATTATVNSGGWNASGTVGIGPTGPNGSISGGYTGPTSTVNCTRTGDAGGYADPAGPGTTTAGDAVNGNDVA